MAMNLVGAKYKCLILYHLSGGQNAPAIYFCYLKGSVQKC